MTINIVEKNTKNEYGFDTWIKVSGGVTGETVHEARQMVEKRLQEVLESSNEDYQKKGQQVIHFGSIDGDFHEDEFYLSDDSIELVA
jgi:hypothetical protein